MYALADVNSFYASCEQLFRPDLKGKAVCAVSNNDGCVIARSAHYVELKVKTTKCSGLLILNRKIWGQQM